MTSIRVMFKADLGDLAREIAKQHAEPEVLEFLGDLDEAMNSWDFTNQATGVFVSRGLDLHRAEDGSIPTARAGLNRVKEFMRQAAIQPHVKASHPIISVWTDPAAEAASLLVSDMVMLVELATSALVREEK